MIPAVMPTYARADIAFERGEGAYLFATDGRRYLDFCSGIAVTALGHAHPRLVEALHTQGAKLWHTSNLFRIPGQERLAAKLVANSFADTVFFCNSGAEAVEAGLKMVRKYQNETGNPERFRVITCSASFHGRTLATIAAAGQEKLLAGFGPPMDGFDHAAFGNMNETRAAVNDRTAAILVEPVQGEGGVNEATAEYLIRCREMADEFGLLLFLDEVQSGMGRTGKLFAYEWSGITPDVVAIAKGLGGGFPIGACLATERAAAGMSAGSHGSTFGGNPLAVAVAAEVLDTIVADGFLDHVVAMGRLLRGRLEAMAKRHPRVIADVRGTGLLLGIQCVPPNGDMVTRLRETGLIAVPAGDNVVRFLPPLIIEESHIEEAMAALEKVCAGFAATEDA
ncbi:MAG: aspartate aminotransferase family protein [Alphaproteobacteria bacterium]